MNKVIKLKKQPKTSESDSIKQLNSKLNKLDKKIDNLYVRLDGHINKICLLYTSPSPRDRTRSRMPSSA